MAGKGPAPKTVLSRPNDTARRIAELTVLYPDGVSHGPELPDGVIDWPLQTLEFWQALRLDAAASTWTEVEWKQLLDVALLHSDLWSGNPKVASEIRLRLAAFGLTPSDRLRVRQVVGKPDDDAPNKLEELRARQTALSRKRRLTKLVNETQQPNSARN